MGYDFKLGEEKEVGVTVESIDGTEFSTTATYKYVDKYSNEFKSGNAEVESVSATRKKVFTLLKPTETGTYQYVHFTCINTPLDDQGQPDPAKNAETIKASTRITVDP